MKMKIIPNTYDEIEFESWKEARCQFGENLPREVEQRLEKELQMIQKNDFTVYYKVAKLIADKARLLGRTIGIRGSSGSSLVAYLLGITGINPLPASYGGYNIPFESFAGVNGEKEPDFDFYLDEETRNQIIVYLKEIFGEKKVVYVSVRKEEVDENLPSEVHPCGVFFFPETIDFKAEMASSDDLNEKVLVTQKEYEELLADHMKIDLLVHPDFEFLRKIENKTKVKASEVKVEDSEILNYVSGEGKALDDISEYATPFAQSLVKTLNPKTLEEWVKISALSHGMDVWTDNAEQLIQSGQCTLKDVIGSSDDIMNILLDYGVSTEDAFEIMKFVSKGLANRQVQQKKWGEYVRIMKLNNVPQWFISSCEKCKYLFSKAYAVSRVQVACRMAYYKMHFPEFYKETVAEI